MKNTNREITVFLVFQQDANRLTPPPPIANPNSEKQEEQVQQKEEVPPPPVKQEDEVPPPPVKQEEEIPPPPVKQEEDIPLEPAQQGEETPPQNDSDVTPSPAAGAVVARAVVEEPVPESTGRQTGVEVVVGGEGREVYGSPGVYKPHNSWKVSSILSPQYNDA